MSKVRKKILIAGPSPARRGGVSHHIKTLLNSPLQNDFHLVYFRVGPEYSDYKLTVIFKFMITPFRFLFQLLTVKPDVLHLNPSFDRKSLLRELPMILLSRIFGCAGLVQFHGGSVENLVKKNRIPVYLKLLLSLAHHVILLTEIQKKALLKFLPTLQASVLPNMVYIPKKSKKYTKREDGFKLLFLSRIERKKGIYDILEAIPLVIEKFPKAWFYFAGEGPDRSNVEKLCSDEKIREHVKFFGHVGKDMKDRLFSESDVFLFPSQHPEGMPYAILEAMAHGLPIIATPVGSLPEIVLHGQNGLLIPTESPHKLAESIIQLLVDFDLRKKMGSMNRKLAEEKFNITVVSQKFKNLYESFSGT